MVNIRELIELYSEIVGPEDPLLPQPAVGGHRLTKGYWDVLRAANGFVVKDSLFRVFGTRPLGSLASVHEWNGSTWKQQFGDILHDTVLVAEDIFGDQYGFIEDERGHIMMVKVYCEGGRIEQQRGDFLDFLQEQVLIPRPVGFDYDLAGMARTNGLRPELNEHLAFRLPLICGGEYNISNLHIESVELHLGLLGQMTLHNRSLPEGTPIHGFSSS